MGLWLPRFAYIHFCVFFRLMLVDGVKIGEMKIFKRSWHSGRNYSKLTTSLINILLKFQMLISQVYQCFFI